MATETVTINVQDLCDSLPADANTNNMTEKHDSENVATSKSVPVLRVEKLKDELNSSFSYTSGEEDQNIQDVHSDIDQKEEDEPEFVPPTDEIKQKIINQVEFYFSDANILKDAFLLKHVRRNKMGYVSLKLITSFKKMKSLTKDYRVVAYSLRESESLEVNEEGKKVRRKNPLPEYDETTPSRSVVVINIPLENPTIEGIAEMFSKCGEVALIRILKPGKPVPQDVKRYAAKHPEIGTSICAVVEFEKHEHAKKAVEMTDKDNWRKGMRVVVLAETKKKHDKSKSNDKKDEPHGDGSDTGEREGDKRKKKRSGRKQRHLDPNDDSSCYSSGSEHDPPSRQNASRNTSLSPNNFDGNKLSPGNSPRTSPRTQRRRLGPHGKSPLAEHSPNGSPRPSPRSSPESGRKKYDYSSGGDSTPSSPWVQRRLKAAQELSKSPLSGSPTGSPLLNKRDGPRRLADMDGVIRLPKGPDGTKGFHLGRGKPRASTIS